ncbi:MAG: alpha/beta hydrolase fold domain-containing protein [Bryobacteraceae bacterium]|nr:alpha/beta hydrolase fold domain-containing protein [Bryobacteraceae bacterium]
MRSPILLLIAAALTASAQQPPQAQPPKLPPMPDNVVHERDIEYSSVGARVAMDIVRPKGLSSTDRLPTVLFIHGGGFRAGNRESYLAQAARLAQRGYVTATASYRLAPRHQFPAAVEDVKAAVRFLRANAAKYNVDTEHIGTMGGSAGGHLVLMLGLTAGVPELEGTGPNRDQSSAVQCVVNYYGPSDFTQSYQKSVDAAIVLPMFLGGDLNHNRRIHQMSSPLNWVTPRAAPTLSIHGTEDTFVAYEQSLWITERLVNAGVPAELETISGAGHGFRGADAERAEARAFAYFDKYLKAKPESRRILVSDHGPKGEIVAMEWPSGRELWTKPNTRGHDVQSLPNGHTLFTIGGQKKVVELDEKQQPVWEYGDGLEHPLAAQRLPSGNTLIADARAGRVLEVTPDKKVVWKYETEDIGKMRMRNAHRTDKGTTLIAVEAVAKLIEVDKSGTIVWSWQAPEKDARRLYMGRRLANGNTVVSLSDPGEIVEVSPDGKVVRSIGGKSLDVQMGWASGFVELPGGNLLISDYTGRRLLEVDPKGKVVNELRTGQRTVASVEVIR